MNGKQIIQELTEERNKLSKIITKKEKQLQSAPEGEVRVIKHNSGYQYYFRKKPSDKNGSYMHVSERNKAATLVQKRYDEQILAASKKQDAAIKRFLNIYDPECLKNIYSSLSDVRKKDVQAVILSDDEYVSKWEEYTYEHKSFAEDMPIHYTDSGNRVRSKSEVMIANALLKEGIPYRYECPLKLGTSLIHPDFTILRKSDREVLYWEHLGMMDDSEYTNRAIQRIRLYEEHGIYPGVHLILTMETVRQPINLEIIKNMIGQYCA